MKKHTLSKSLVVCYKIRTADGYTWADITLDTEGDNGRISIASDYGDWQRYWEAAGPFKPFLTRLNMNYAAEKFGEGHWLDIDATLKTFRKDIREYKKEDKAWRTGNAAKLLECVKLLEDDRQLEFMDALHHDCTRLVDFYNFDPPLTHTVSPRFKRFWKELWPIFVKQLKKEIAEEAKEQPACNQISNGTVYGIPIPVLAEVLKVRR